MKKIFDPINALFDRMHAFWEGHYSRTLAAALILLVYVLSLAAIELGRRGVLPENYAAMMPKSHYAAIGMAFTFLLYLELIDIVFGLAESVSRSVGKQFEIFSLILLRQSFKDFSAFPEPLQWPATPESVLHILSNAVGALTIFAILVLYYRSLHHQPITLDEEETSSFISSKKAVALMLMLIFIVLGVYDLFAAMRGEAVTDFFATFYTIMVFFDILIVLVSMRYSQSYPVVFRNSAFAMVTVMLRLGLAAPVYYNALLGAGASIFLLGLNGVYNMYGQPPDTEK